MPRNWRGKAKSNYATVASYILWVKFYIVSENYMADYMAINVQMISVFVLFFS